MNIFKEIVHLIEDFTDMPEDEENIVRWAKENKENEAIFNIYTFAAFSSVVNNAEMPDKKKKRQKVKKCIRTILKNIDIQSMQRSLKLNQYK